MAQAAGSFRLRSVRQEFPTEWAKFQSQTPATNQRFELTLNLRPEHFPFWSKGRLQGLTRVDILTRSAAIPVPATLGPADKIDRNDVNAQQDTLPKDATLGNLLVGKLENIGLPPTPIFSNRKDFQFTLFLDDKDCNDLWFGMSWN